MVPLAPRRRTLLLAEVEGGKWSRRGALPSLSSRTAPNMLEPQNLLSNYDVPYVTLMCFTPLSLESHGLSARKHQRPSSQYSLLTEEKLRLRGGRLAPK